MNTRVDNEEEVYEPEDHHDIGADTSTGRFFDAEAHYNGGRDKQSEEYSVKDEDHGPFSAFHPAIFVNIAI